MKKPRGRPAKEGGGTVKFTVQDNVWEHLERLVREAGIGATRSEAAKFLFTVEVQRSMKDATLYSVDPSNWKKVPVDDEGEQE